MTRTMSTSGDGTRPTTSGGIDNIGGAEKFTGKTTPAGTEVTGPAPAEKMQGKRHDAESVRHVDSSAFDLREDGETEPNTEPATKETVAAASDPGRRP